MWMSGKTSPYRRKGLKFPMDCLASCFECCSLKLVAWCSHICYNCSRLQLPKHLLYAYPFIMAYKHNISSNVRAAKISHSLDGAFPLVVYEASLEQYKPE